MMGISPWKIATRQPLTATIEVEEKPAARAAVIGTGMFLPALIVFLIGLAVILYFACDAPWIRRRRRRPVLRCSGVPPG